MTFVLEGGTRDSGLGRATTGLGGVGYAQRTRCRELFPSPESRKTQGFTLLEMLAVIVLIGIIGTVVVTQVGKNVDKGKYGAGKAQLTTLSEKIENYALDNGAPPQQLEDLLVKPPNAPNWQGPYAKASGLKDPWGHTFGYQYPGQHGSFDLVFYGQDGKPGGDGYSRDVGSWQ
ncbi:MAG TPA: type II secretion system major pseudopilin GspG [Rhodanobacter sp.]|nr:type II secretion system major pseudopilin GspG [Rhodanobacter sp.]